MVGAIHYTRGQPVTPEDRANASKIVNFLLDGRSFDDLTVLLRVKKASLYSARRNKPKLIRGTWQMPCPNEDVRTILLQAEKHGVTI